MYADKVRTMVKARDFRRHLRAFRQYVRSRDLSPQTLQTYNEALRRFHGWLVGAHGEKADISARCVREFAAKRLADGKKPLTVRAELTALRAFFSFLVFDGLIPEGENPMRRVENPRICQPEIRPLTREETQRLLDSFDQDRPVERRNYVMCLLILDTGLRIGEAARLRLDDIDLEQSRIQVLGKGRKQRAVFMGRKMVGILTDYIEQCRPGMPPGDLQRPPYALPRDDPLDLPYSAPPLPFGNNPQQDGRSRHSEEQQFRASAETHLRLQLRQGGRQRPRASKAPGPFQVRDDEEIRISR